MSKSESNEEELRILIPDGKARADLVGQREKSRTFVNQMKAVFFLNRLANNFTFLNGWLCLRYLFQMHLIDWPFMTSGLAFEPESISACK